jgi:uncharacterized protein YcfJ
MLTARFFKPALLMGVLLPGLAMAATSYDRAEVLSVEPLFETVTYEVPREQCHIQRIGYRRNSVEKLGGRGSATGPILGAIIGGALGNAVGHHKRNKQVGTVVGAILGASVGADIARRNRQNSGHVSYVDEEVCHVVNEIREEERLLGYRVTYRYASETYVTRMDRDPGRSLRVRVRVTPA